MDDNELQEQEEQEQEEIQGNDNSEILTEINGNLVTINGNITTTYELLQAIETKIDTQNDYLSNIYEGVKFVSNFSLTMLVILLMILSIKYLKQLL